MCVWVIIYSKENEYFLSGWQDIVWCAWKDSLRAFTPLPHLFTLFEKPRRQQTKDDMIIMGLVCLFWFGLTLHKRILAYLETIVRYTIQLNHWSFRYYCRVPMAENPLCYHLRLLCRIQEGHHGLLYLYNHLDRGSRHGSPCLGQKCSWTGRRGRVGYRDHEGSLTRHGWSHGYSCA